MKNPETKVDRNAATMKEELKDMNNRNGMDKRQYYDLKKRSEIREGAQKLRKQYLRYREAGRLSVAPVFLQKIMQCKLLMYINATWIKNK